MRIRALQLEHVHVPNIAVQNTVVDTLGAGTSHVYAPVEICSDQFWHEDALQSRLSRKFVSPDGNHPSS
jgi:hypothetical protein